MSEHLRNADCPQPFFQTVPVTTVFSWELSEVDATLPRISLQMRKPWHREGKCIARGHTAER